jgi:galactan 5-O-arabinofuranosyltransferase
MLPLPPVLPDVPGQERRADPLTPGVAPSEGSTTARRFLLAGGEVAFALVACLLFAVWATTIEVDPLDRVGQVSGLAALQLRFLLVALTCAVIAGAVVRARPRARDGVVRLACALLAGLSTGITAGGLVVALRGTPWPLVPLGDSFQLATWASDVQEGRAIPGSYPPLFVHLLARYAELTDQITPYALKDLYVVSLALIGPTAYLAWRLVLPPVWALVIGVVAALPFATPYKAFTYLPLLAVLPLLVWLTRAVRTAHCRSLGANTARGAVLGLAVGLLFLLYSGWFVWPAPGVVVAVAMVVPWRRGPGRALVLLGSAGAVFLAVAAWHLVPLLTAAGTIQDTYFYFDALADPAYVAMFRNDYPGADAANWPPPGELGGVGLFTVLLAVGLGSALALGARRSLVIMVGSCAVSAWLFRFVLASQMYETQTVQLWPRTLMQILYCLLVLCGYAVYLAVRRSRLLLSAVAAPVGPHGPRRAAGIPVAGAFAGLALVFSSAASATADTWMPTDLKGSAGELTMMSHTTRTAEGPCPRFAPEGVCEDSLSQYRTGGSQ